RGSAWLADPGRLLPHPKARSIASNRPSYRCRTNPLAHLRQLVIILAAKHFACHETQGGSAMSRTLNLAAHLLARGRSLQELGRDDDALDILGRLACFRELPAAVAEETQARLGELHLRRRRFRKAGRCLTAALAHRPNNARYHYLLASALDAPDKGEPERAA